MTSRISRRASLACCSAWRQHVGREAVDLGVELQRGDELGRAGDLEVHVAERVLGAEDVGEGRVLALGVDEAHGDAGDRRLDRHAGVHQRQRRAAHRRHRRRAVRRQHVGDDAQRVGQLLRARARPAAGPARRAAPWPISRRFGPPTRPGLAGGVGREVVVVHVALAGRRADACRASGPCAACRAW